MEERRRTRIRWEKGGRSGNRKDRGIGGSGDGDGDGDGRHRMQERREKAGICSHRAINEGMNVQTSTSQRSFIDQIV